MKHISECKLGELVAVVALASDWELVPIAAGSAGPRPKASSPAGHADARSEGVAVARGMKLAGAAPSRRDRWLLQQIGSAKVAKGWAEQSGRMMMVEGW